VVTANHREQKLESVPYSISVVSSDQLSNAGITDLASLTQNLPGLSMYDAGARMRATVPIIRGINAPASPRAVSAISSRARSASTSTIRRSRAISSSTYQAGRSSARAAAQLCGSLGGALRLLPNAPEFGKLEGNVTGSIGTVSHASQPSIPPAALASARCGAGLPWQSIRAGFIDAYGLMRRSEAGDRLAAARQSG
jgi:outer membrane receptor protein involved in Fe transport